MSRISEGDAKQLTQQEASPTTFDVCLQGEGTTMKKLTTALSLLLISPLVAACATSRLRLHLMVTIAPIRV